MDWKPFSSIALQQPHIEVIFFGRSKSGEKRKGKSEGIKGGN
jgi:hypothetical protein